MKKALVIGTMITSLLLGGCKTAEKCINPNGSGNWQVTSYYTTTADEKDDSIYTNIIKEGPSNQLRTLEEISNFFSTNEKMSVYKKFFKKDEYIVPNDIFDVYARIVDSRKATFWGGGGPVGGYLANNFLNTKEKEELLRKELEKGYSKDCIDYYINLLTKKDCIIFKEDIFKHDYIKKALPHERMHKEMKRLSDSKRNALQEAYFNLKEREFDDPVWGKSHFIEDKLEYCGFVASAVHMNWEELYTYMAQGALKERCEEALKKDFPRAYAIFDKMRKKCAWERTE